MSECTLAWMTSRAMIVVGGGSSTRFGADKLLATVAGAPLVAHTVRSVQSSVDRCVLVCRPDQLAAIRSLGLGVDLVPGGSTRTESEIAGLSQVEEAFDLIGVHDGARPLVSPRLVDALFEAAARHGGAIPVLDVPLLVDRSSLTPLSGAGAAQTPQVFAAADLLNSFRAAERDGFRGHDTAEVVARYSDVQIAAIPGEATNVKVTYAEDIALIERMLEDRARSEPR